MAERHMIRIDRKPNLFSFRVAGLMLRDGHALVHRNVLDDFWSLPGGRAEIGESSDQTIIREMREELGVTVSLGRMLFVVENFFAFEGYQAHELGMYYLIDAPPEFPFATDRVVHTVVDGQTDLEFRWIAATRAAFTAMNVYPLLLRERIETLPERAEHVVHREET